MRVCLSIIIQVTMSYFLFYTTCEANTVILVFEVSTRQDIEKYKSLFSHVSAAIQLSTSSSTCG
jgi:hypothetical protein